MNKKHTKAYYKESRKIISIDFYDHDSEFYYNISNGQIYTKEGSMNVTDRFIIMDKQPKT